MNWVFPKNDGGENGAAGNSLKKTTILLSVESLIA